jgi:DNA-binding SARP family transcriptional activator/Tfp pilus assembly protein PilF
MTVPAYRLHLFGGVTVAVESTALPVRNRKLRAVIGYLALAPGARASRERLVGLLWGDRGEEHARASLRQALLDLRRTAPGMTDLLVTDRLDVALVEDGWESDLLGLEDAIARSDLQQLAVLLSAVDGPLLAGLDGLGPAFDDWLRTERARREALLVAGALAAAERGAAGAAAAARSIADSLCRLWPGEEAATRLGMRLDQQAGDLAAMHRRFRQLERHLKADLDAEPAAETLALMAELTARSRASAERTAPSAAPSISGPGGEAPVVVVSPLSPVPGDEGGAGLVAVLCHDLVAALQRLPDLRVLSLSHATPDRLERVGGRAIAAYALSCSTRPAAAGVRLTFSLTEIESGRAVWSHAAETPQERLGAAIGEAVDRVAGAVLPTVERDLVRSRRLSEASPEAYALYLRGRIGVLGARTYEEATRFAQYLEQALAIDPGFANPRHHLASYYNNDFLQRIAGHDTAPWRQRALTLAAEAVHLEPDNGDAISRLAWCHMRRGDWASAMALVDRALAAGATHAETIERCGHGLCLAGDIQRGRFLIQRAFALNPFPRSDYFADLAIADALEGRFGEAAEQLAFAGDPSIYYLMVQTAVVGHAGSDETAGALADQLRERLSTIWAGPRPPDDQSILVALHQYFPIRLPGHLRMLVEGLQKAGIAAGQEAVSA